MRLTDGPSPARRPGVALIISVAVHAALLAGALHMASGRGGVQAAPQPRAAVLVMLMPSRSVAPPAPPAPAAAPRVASRPAPPRMAAAPVAMSAPGAAGTPASSAADTTAALAPAVPVADAAPRASAAIPAPAPPAIRKAEPDYAFNPAPDYPLLLREQGVGGVVWLKVWVLADGRPGDIVLARGSGYRLFDEAALRAVRHWRFVPARQGEQTLASWVEFPIRFALQS